MLEEEAPEGLCPLFQDRSYWYYKISDEMSVSVHCRQKKSYIDVTAIACKLNDLHIDNVWPGALVIADYLTAYPELYTNKYVLELGAGCALPSCVAAKVGAQLQLVCPTR